MKDWILGSLFVISASLVVAGLLFLFGAIMWALDLPPDNHPMVSMLAGIGSLAAGYWYFGWALDRINKRAWDKALGRR